MAKTTAKTTAPKNTALKTTALKTTGLKNAAAKNAALKPSALKPGLKTPTAKPPVKDELVHSHPTMCLHCHLIVEMFHERGADPVKGAWQCPRCAHKYLFSHWKIKRQARGKSEAA